MRILVVDDDANVRAVVRVMLEDAGFEVAEAADGEEALRTFKRLGADLILGDVFMPGRDGLQLLRDLRAASLGVRVIAMSGGGNFHGTVDLLPLARFLGAVTVLNKPFNQQELQAAVARALQAPPLA
jgi:two-component system, NtrC family, response regulator AtoC